MTFDIDFLQRILATIFKAMPLTLLLAFLSCIGASLVGFALETLRRTGRWQGYLLRFVIDALRSTPILVQIYFLYFVLPYYGVVLPGPVIGVLAMSLYYASYLAEVFKAGIDSVPRGQTEAAMAVGLSPLDVTLRVVAPQMLRNIAAPMGNYFVSILKSTPYLAVIGVAEMMGTTLEIASDTFRYAEPMILLGIVFLVLCSIIAWLVRRLEARLMANTRR
ncbi:MAG: amino acid ABC transporter permease [Rhodobacteraceae bacterium]|nr:amino acid ABC transporter permease [Paracoccaceae bacterium]MBR9821745.1 amino acid ABC transporter permease [Paracoccaceae bacterium]